MHRTHGRHCCCHVVGWLYTTSRPANSKATAQHPLRPHVTISLHFRLALILPRCRREQPMCHLPWRRLAVPGNACLLALPQDPDAMGFWGSSHEPLPAQFSFGNAIKAIYRLCHISVPTCSAENGGPVLPSIQEVLRAATPS